MTYEMQDIFTSPVNGHHYSLRCFPIERSCQKVKEEHWKIFPGSVNAMEVDSFGNQILTGKCEAFHERFYVSVSAIVCVENGTCTDSRESYQLGMFRSQTSLTKMGKELQKFYQEQCPVKETDVWKRTKELMNCLVRVFRYEKNTTTVRTTAEEAFALGSGVCQDYAHILLSLCRRSGMTARYVAGSIPGEGETHAWIEVYKDGIWKGFDPTHNREVDENYICFVVGRDASDCLMNRGIFYGPAGQQMKIYVKMEECL